MWNCVSKKSLRRTLFVLLLLFMVAAIAFYGIQNSAGLPGGNIAVVKLAWLFLVIFCWFIIPFMLLGDNFSKTVKITLYLFFASMLLRAIIELLMMFWTGNWHPYYGIAHDIFMLLLSLFASAFLWRKNRLISSYLLVMSVLFTVESGFAWYMLNYVHNTSGIVYYVPAGQAHQKVLQITFYVVLATLVYLIFFIRKWLYETSPEC